jgi:spermidine synthase/MFS family permease
MPPPAPPAVQSPAGRLAVVGLVVFLANAGLLVLQLVAGRLLAPFVGSSLETWTAVIGAFLTGIALGNGLGGRYSRRTASPAGLAGVLLAGALAAVWMVALPELLRATGLHRGLPLNLRVPVLAALLCLPAGFTLSLLTPAAIRLGLPDLRRAGRVAGLIFALGTLGCLAGNYVTGFVLIPHFTINAIVFVTAGLLVGTAVLARVGLSPLGDAAVSVPGARLPVAAQLSLSRACAIVFVCSFAGMTLELAASRLLAQVVGVSLYTWTGIIGVMLAGTAAGNSLGGLLADRPTRPGRATGRERLAYSLLVAAAGVALVLILFAVLVRSETFAGVPLIPRVLLWTFALFFLPMLALGTVSPQAIRLAVTDVDGAGATAGRVYAWSTAGAIVGTFATGYVLISGLGMFRTILLVALLPGLLTPLLVRVHETRALLYGLSVIFGGVGTGVLMVGNYLQSIERETNYYTIRVEDWTMADGSAVKALQLDMLTHSCVKLDDPTYIYYPHENTQLDFVRLAAAAHPGGPRVLVVGGGGYTLPRCAGTVVPNVEIDVVEIDPGVTRVAYDRLGLDPALPIATFNQDGRQFLEDRAGGDRYHVVALDAVNDFSVPGHLLTRECNEAVKRALTPDGVYLVTVIDVLQDGRLWKAVVRTLRESFAHVEVLTPTGEYYPQVRGVYSLYASAVPFDQARFEAKLTAAGQPRCSTYVVARTEIDRMLSNAPTVLTDQFAPVDNMMSGVFRTRE